MCNESPRLKFMLEPALSLIVDGKEIFEALVLNYDEYIIKCFPCHVSMVKVNNIIKLVRKIRASDKVKPYESCAITSIGKNRIIIYFLKQSITLILFVNPKVNIKKIALGFMQVFDKIKNISITY